MRINALLPALFVSLACWISPGQVASHGTGGEAGARREAPAHEAGDPYLFYKWVNFAILAGGLGYLAVKVGGPALKGRQKSILAMLDEAARRAARTAEQTSAVERKVAGLAGEIESMKLRAAEEMAAEVREFELETARLLGKVDEASAMEISSAVQHARKELKAMAADLALSMAAQRLQTNARQGGQEAMVERFIRSLGKLKGTGN